MMNYKIYKTEYDDEYIVEIFNKCDISNIQNELTSKGYIIDYMINYGNGNTPYAYMKVYKEDKSE